MALILHLDLAWLTILFFNDVISYASYSFAELFDSTSYSHHSIVDWRSIDSTSERRALRERPRRVLEASELNWISLYCIDYISYLQVPLLS